MRVCDLWDRRLLTPRSDTVRNAAHLRMGEGGKAEFDFGDSGKRQAGPAAAPARQTARRPPASRAASTTSAPTGTTPEWPVCPKCGQGRIIQGRS